MARDVVRIDGLKDLDKALGELPKATARAALHRVLRKAGAPIAEEAARLAPDDPTTGAPDLHTSIAVSTKLKNPAGKKEYAAVMRAGGTKAEAGAAMRTARREGNKSFAEIYVGPGKGGAHGVLQEFGTVHHGPQPFMRPAWDSKKSTALNIIADELGNEIMKSAKRLAKKRARAKG